LMWAMISGLRSKVPCVMSPAPRPAASMKA
jgi:hypothetical protein